MLARALRPVPPCEWPPAAAQGSIYRVSYLRVGACRTCGGRCQTSGQAGVGVLFLQERALERLGSGRLDANRLQAPGLLSP